MKTTKAHISTLRHGDTVLIDNKQITLSNSNLKRCSFMGISINGDSSVKMIDVVLFPKWCKGELIGHVRQP